MSAIGNLLWFLAGGVLMGLGWWLVGMIMFCTVVGIPWGRACFVMGRFAFLPFGREAIGRQELTGQRDIGTGGLGTLGNIIWFVCGGLWLALGHALSALLCAVTIIGIPFAIQHLKLAGLAMAPIGKTIVSKSVAEAARRSTADELVARHRGV